MDNSENFLHFIGLMKKAGAISIGSEAAYDAVRTGKARLLLLAADAAKNTVDGAKNAQGERDTLLLVLPFTKAQLGEALGQRECASMAVTDTGFALSLCEKQGESEKAAVLKDRLLREKRRKQKKLSGKKQATVNRGKNSL